MLIFASYHCLVAQIYLECVSKIAANDDILGKFQWVVNIAVRACTRFLKLVIELPTVITSRQCVFPILKALACVLGTDADELALCMLGTTHFVNACTECKGLSKVAAIRLCGTATRALPPFCSLPPRLRSSLEGMHAMVSGELSHADTGQGVLSGTLNTAMSCCFASAHASSSTILQSNHWWWLVQGGYEYDGGQVIAETCDAEIEEAVVHALDMGCRAFAVSGVFSPVNAAQEQHAANVVRAVAQQHSGGCAAAHVLTVCAQAPSNELTITRGQSVISTCGASRGSCCECMLWVRCPADA